MAEIRSFPVVRHARADATAFVIHYRNARPVRSGRGLSFWFRPLSDSLAEIPIDGRQLTLVVHSKSADFQDVTVQGVLTYRAQDPERLADRIDFTIDLRNGQHVRQPLEKIELMLSQLAQEYTSDYVARNLVRDILAKGLVEIRERLEAGFATAEELEAMGLAIESVRISSVRPTADLEKAIEAPTRERIKQEADEASFARRAMAVEKERAIAENELHNKIELARRQEQLLAQEGQNARRRAQDQADAHAIEARGQADRLRIQGEAEADSIRAIEGARAQVERTVLDAYRDTAPAVVLGLAAKEFAGKIRTIEHLSLAPDMLSPLLATLIGAGTRRLESGN